VNPDKDSDFLSPESRARIEGGFDQTSAQIGVWFLAAVRQLKRLVIALLVLLVVVYAGEDLSVRYRIPKDREPFGAVEVQRYFAVHLKSGKTEINYDKSENEVCTNSIFPHLGFNPCWYVRQHTRKMIDI
jgi:hypothetical protein